MSVNMTFYSNFSKRENSTKQPSGGTPYDVVFKDAFSIIGGTVKLQANFDTAKNYTAAKYENNFYNVVDVVSTTNNIVEITLDNGEESLSLKISKKLRDKTTDRYSFKDMSKSPLAFDHSIVILAGIERLRNKVNYTDIVFNMMPEYFTLGELQQVYEVILNKKLLDPAFRRIIADKVVKSEKMRTGGGHRPSVLFKYKR